MNIDYLRYFLDVADTKSITRAARLNFISPQGMSRAMNELEKELDCKLLVRYSNKLSLSEQGEELVPVAKKVVEQYTQLADLALKLNSTDLPENKERRIRILCQAICGLCFIPPQTIDLLDKLDSPIIYREMDTQEICQVLRTEVENNNGKPKTPQIGIMSTFDTKKAENFQGIRRLEELGYTYKPYLKTYDKCIVPIDSPLANMPAPLTRDQVTSLPIVTTNSILYESIAERFGAENIIMTTGEFLFRVRYIHNHNAVTFMPAIGGLTLNRHYDITTVDFDDAYEIEIGFLGMKEDLESPAFVEFIETLDDFYKNEHGDSDLFTLL